jgi:hypothetical protein
MKLGTDKQNKLFDRGKETWERTEEFKKRIITIRQEVRDKYQVRLESERNWFRRQLIKLQFLIELKKRTNEISSAKNLHLKSSWI